MNRFTLFIDNIILFRNILRKNTEIIIRRSIYLLGFAIADYFLLFILASQFRETGFFLIVLERNKRDIQRPIQKFPYEIQKLQACTTQCFYLKRMCVKGKKIRLYSANSDFV